MSPRFPRKLNCLSAQKPFKGIERRITAKLIKQIKHVLNSDRAGQKLGADVAIAFNCNIQICLALRFENSIEPS
jgi:hypothetical protein